MRALLVPPILIMSPFTPPRNPLHTSYSPHLRIECRRVLHASGRDWMARATSLGYLASCYSPVFRPSSTHNRCLLSIHSISASTQLILPMACPLLLTFSTPPLLVLTP